MNLKEQYDELQIQIACLRDDLRTAQKNLSELQMALTLLRTADEQNCSEAVLNHKVSEIGLSPRIVNIFKNYGIETVLDLTQESYSHMRIFSGYGIGCEL